jgi:hypothetical protein
VRDHLTFKEIARQLSESGVRGYGPKPLSIATIRNIVSNGLCIGQMTYNMTTVKLQSRPLKNPEETWTRFPAFEPIVPLAQFQKAQELRSRCKKGIGATRRSSIRYGDCLRRKGASRRY